MFSNHIHRRITLLFLIPILFAGTLYNRGRTYSVLAGSGQDFQPAAVRPGEPANPAEPASRIFIPTSFSAYPRVSPFAVETYATLHSDSSYTGKVQNLKLGWIRLGERVSWRKLQPNYGDPIQWGLLANFENELRTLQQAGFTPVIVIYDSPHWAVDANARSDGKLSSCAPIREDMFDEFASFVRSLVNRYKTPDFNVHNWELGNEPDVEPDWVGIDNGFGCWGDDKDPLYFGGKQYGAMLKVVTPAIRAEDRTALVWLGGLLLAAPQASNYLTGKQALAPTEYQLKGIDAAYASGVRPELFFKGVLEAGAAPYFDILPFHWYPSYYPLKVDFDLKSGQTWWDNTGGGVTGKAKYLRDLMEDYDVTKPLNLNETGLGCINDDPRYYWCNPPSDQVFQAQADYLVRTFVRGIGQGIAGFSWYLLEENGWRYLGLLDGNLNPKPTYWAYQQLASQLQDSYYVGPVSYGSGIEAYAFRKGDRHVQVLWAREDNTYSIRVPLTRFVDARKRDGTMLMPFPVDNEIQVSVGFSPVYLTLAP